MLRNLFNKANKKIFLRLSSRLNPQKREILVEPSIYGGFFRICEGPNNSNFHISHSASLSMEIVEDSANKTIYCFRDDSVRINFETFYKQWLKEEAVLYRGFSGNHFCWDRLRQTGELISEGPNDYPQATMGSNSKTSWLPSSDIEKVAQSITLGNIDPLTHAAIKAKKNKVPVGAVIKIPTNKNTIAWLNDGEIVVRGPLQKANFNIESITWLIWLTEQQKESIPLKTVYHSTSIDLPPTRPFKPKTQKEIDDWWIECEKWLNNYYKFCGSFQPL